MQIKLLQPFDKYLGKPQLSINLDKPLTTLKLIAYLLKTYPHLAEHLNEDKPEEVLTSKFMLVRNGALLKAEDVIHKDDKLIMIPPIMGG